MSLHLFDVVVVDAHRELMYSQCCEEMNDVNDCRFLGTTLSAGPLWWDVETLITMQNPTDLLLRTAVLRTAGEEIRTCSGINNPCVDKTLSKILCALTGSALKGRSGGAARSFCKMEKKQNMTCTDSLGMYTVGTWARRVGTGFLSCHGECGCCLCWPACLYLELFIYLSKDK